MIRQAAELGLLTTPYAFNPDEAAAMAKAGCDILIPHMGLTTKGSIGASTAVTLEEAARRCQAMHDAAKRIKPDVLVLCHGGPIAEPEDASISSTHRRHRRLLRRQQHGTATGRNGADGKDSRVYGAAIKPERIAASHSRRKGTFCEHFMDLHWDQMQESAVTRKLAFRMFHP